MIQKLLCWLFGHKTVFKAATGDILVIDTPFLKDQKVPLVKWERSNFCLHCGVPVHKKEEVKLGSQTG